MEKGVCYLRVSSKEQEKEGYSLQSQEKESTNYAERKGIELVKSWKVTESAGKEGRKNFNEMVNFAVKNKDIKHIIFEKVDRFTRNFYDLIKLYDLMQKYDKQIHFFKEGLIMNKDSKSQDKLRLDIQVVFARNYINNLSEEVKKGMKEKAEDGEFPQHAPLGYLNNTETHLIEIDSEHAYFIKKMFELYATCEYSFLRLKNKITDEGLRTKTGRKLHRSEIEYILRNPIYYGYFYWKDELYKGIHNPIIDKSLFDKVQQAMRRFNKPKLTKRSFPFTGLLTCGKCGCSITAEIKKGKYVYYHCTGYKGKCGNTRIRQEELEEKLGEVIKDIQIDDKIRDWFIDTLKQSHADKEQYHTEVMQSLNKQYQKLQERLDKAYLDKLDGIIPEEFWLSKSKLWREEQENVLNQIKCHQHSDEGYMELGIKILELANKSYELWKVRKSEEKRQLLNFVVSNCVLDGVNVIPTYKKPFDILAKGNRSLTWLPGLGSNQRPFGYI